MSPPVRILIVDDQALFRQGLRTLLDAHPEIEVVEEASNGDEALRLAAELLPEVILMDLQMPVMDGVTATRHIKTRFPHIRVIVLTTFADDQYLFEGLRAGAVGYLLKDASVQELVEAIQAAVRGDGFLQPAITLKVIEAAARQVGTGLPPSPLVEPLTFRELDILRLLADGMNNREIADKLVITEGTVKNHVSNIIGKLGVRDRTQAALKARELRLI